MPNRQKRGSRCRYSRAKTLVFPSCLFSPYLAPVSSSLFSTSSLPLSLPHHGLINFHASLLTGEFSPEKSKSWSFLTAQVKIHCFNLFWSVRRCALISPNITPTRGLALFIPYLYCQQKSPQRPTKCYLSATKDT